MTVERDGFSVIAVIGVGLIGGSLGLAARKRGLVDRVIGIGRNEKKLTRAKDLGAIDEFTLDMSTGVAEADLVVVCTPVCTIVPTIVKIAPHLKPGAIITDVGSAKAEVVAGAEAALPGGVHFVGGHPMAGSEKSGVEAANADLFENAAWVITPSLKTNLRAMKKLTEFARKLGARTLIMSPAEHDESVAAISHVPHVLAAAALQVANELEQQRPGDVFSIAAGSFRDLTRVAASPPEIWRDISLSNREAISRTLRRFEETLAQMRSVVDSGDEAAVEQLFKDAKELREQLMREKRGHS
jgi:prephenate dehydrogenase